VVHPGLAAAIISRRSGP